jgi:hypothetical protein
MGAAIAACHTVGRSTQDHLVQAALEHSDRGGRGLNLRVGDRAFLPGWACRGRIAVRLGLRDVGTCACNVVFGPVKRLSKLLPAGVLVLVS